MIAARRSPSATAATLVVGGEAVAVVEPAYETIEVAADPNGLAFLETLYVADARSGAIVGVIPI